MSRRIQSEAKPVSLFSFLDSLICTMGSLILLFMVMTNKIQQQATDRALAERAAAVAARQSESETVEEPEVIVPEVDVPEPEPEALPQPRYTEEDRQRELAERAGRRTRREAEWAKKVEEAKIKRDRELAAQRERQRSLTEIELEFRRIKERMFATSQVSEATAQAREAVLSTEKKLKGQEEQVIQQIETTRRNLDVAQRRQATASNEYALVPYDGTSGTMRRPIYIECTGSGYRFVPENIFIGAEHLDGFSEAYNPLLTGTQALMRYWNARRKISGSEPEPYVLLIVRPSGALSYYLARKLLAPLGANFGYELVEEDWKVSSRDVDPQAKAALTDAVEITVEARAKVRDSATGKGGDDSFVFNSRRFPRGSGFPEELVTNPDGGGGDGGGTFAERAGNRARGAGSGTGTGGSSAGPGRERARVALGGNAAGNEGDGGAPGGLGNGTNGSNGGRSGHGAPGSGENGSGGTGRQRAVAGNMSGRPTSSGTSVGGGEPGAGNEFRGGTGQGFEGSDGSGIGEDGVGPGESAGPGSRDGSARRRPGRPGSARPAVIGGGSAGEFEDEDGTGGGGDRSNRGSRMPQNGTRSGSAGGGRGAMGGGAGAPSGEGAEVPPLEPLPDQMSPSHGHNPRVRSSDSGGTPGRLRNLEPEKAPPMDDIPEDPTPQPRAFGQSSGDRPWLPEDSPAVGGRGGNSGGRGSRFAGPRGGGGGGGSDPQRGGRRQWGNGRAGRAGIGLEKQLEIHAFADRLAIGPNDATIGVGRGEKNDELTNKVLSGIEHTAQTWGAPPANFYWIPAVKWIVHPGGNQYYERLRGPLEKWGINSTVEYNVSESAAGQQGGPRR